MNNPDQIKASENFQSPTQKTADVQTDNQLYYEPVGIPAETSGAKGARVMGIFSIICAVISLLFIPILFGPIGIIIGVNARKKGEATLGMVGIILSAVFMVIGIILSITLYILKDKGIISSLIFPAIFR